MSFVTLFGLIDSVIILLEFKVGARQFDRASLDQVWDYALDLKNFHEGSHDLTIVPVLVATGTDTAAHRTRSLSIASRCL